MRIRSRRRLVWGNGELIKYRNADGVELQAALYKPENFDPSKKYPMMVYLYERLSQNVHNFVRPGARPFDQLLLLRQQWLPGADAGHRLHHRASGAERAQVRPAGGAGGGRQGLRQSQRHRDSGPQLGRLPDRVPGDADQPVSRRGGRRAGGEHDQRLRRHSLGQRACRASSSTRRRRAGSADRSGSRRCSSSRTRRSSW